MAGGKMNKEEIIVEILEREWIFFQMANNKGGRAGCQDNREEFIIMRKSQWETFPLNILESYLEDLKNAKEKRQNIVVEKYARMMEYSVPSEYEMIKDFLPKISFKKKETVDEIVKIYLNWEKDVIKKYPKLTSNARPLYSKDDTPDSASIETYLRGELYSYSEKTLNLYYEYINECIRKNKNLALENIKNIVLKKGFLSLGEAEESLV